MCKTIKLKVRFDASPSDVYESLIDARKHAAFTGVPAEIDARVGGRFSSYDGAAQGVVVDLLPGRRIVQAWRAREFPEGIFSMAAFVLVPTKSGGTELTLTHRGVPKDLIPKVVEDWRRLYWEKMKSWLPTSRA